MNDDLRCLRVPHNSISRSHQPANMTRTIINNTRANKIVVANKAQADVKAVTIICRSCTHPVSREVASMNLMGVLLPAARSKCMQCMQCSSSNMIAAAARAGGVVRKLSPAMAMCSPQRIDVDVDDADSGEAGLVTPPRKGPFASAASPVLYKRFRFTVDCAGCGFYGDDNGCDYCTCDDCGIELRRCGGCSNEHDPDCAPCELVGEDRCEGECVCIFYNEFPDTADCTTCSGKGEFLNEDGEFRGLCDDCFCGSCGSASKRECGGC